MSENHVNLFVEAGEDAANSGKRSLAGTVQLNSVASEIANKVMSAVATGDDRELFEASKSDNNSLDQLIKKYGNLEEAATRVEFLKELDADTLAKLLRSRQSTRSHTKGKPMTADTYRTLLMNGAAELLIRIAIEKPKGANLGNQRGTRVAILYTAEDLAAFSENQEDLRREMRNLASRKSIYKRREDFDENSETWQQILQAEEQLRGVRVKAPRVNGTVVVKNQIAEIIGDRDIETIKGGDAKKLLSEIAKAMGLIAEPTSGTENPQ